MSESIFGNTKELDTDYLDAAYDSDAETAAMVFEQYLTELPANLKLLTDSYTSQDIQAFQHHIHKQKPGFSYVGLTDVTAKCQELQQKCLTKEGFIIYKTEIESMLERIRTSAVIIESLRSRLQDQ